MKAELPKRKPLRLSGHDYAEAGMYFLTACTYNKCCTLASIRRGDPCGRPLLDRTTFGAAVEAAITYTAGLYGVTIDHFVIMPNHVHLLLTLPAPERRATARVAPTTGLIVGGIKSIAANAYFKTKPQRSAPLWQRGYHDHVVRDEADYLRLWTYIDENPAHWLEDCYYTNEP